MAKTLYIVIPCYNEELVIDETIKRITEKLDKLIKNNKGNFIDNVNDVKRVKCYLLMTVQKIILY